MLLIKKYVVKFDMTDDFESMTKKVKVLSDPFIEFHSKDRFHKKFVKNLNQFFKNHFNEPENEDFLSNF